MKSPTPHLRHEHAEDAADSRQEQALGEQLPDEADPLGAERRADRHLAHAADGPRQHQVGDVRARDEQQAADRAEEHEQRQPDAADEPVGERAEADPHLRVRLRVLAARAPPAMALISARARSSVTPGFETRDAAQEVRLAEFAGTSRAGRRAAPRNPRARAPKRNASGMIAGHEVQRAPISDRPADERPIAAEAALPEPVRQHDDAVLPGDRLLGPEVAADRRADAEQPEEVRRDDQAADAFGVPRPR